MTAKSWSRIQQVGQHAHGRNSHASKRAYGIKTLREVEPARGALLAAQRKDERVGRGLEKRKAKGQNIQREAEESEALARGCGNKQEGANGIQGQSQQDAALVTEAPNEQRGRHCHGGIPAIKGKLNEAGLGSRQLHQRLEGCHHGVGDVVGKAPERKKRGDGHERE